MTDLNFTPDVQLRNKTYPNKTGAGTGAVVKNYTYNVDHENDAKFIMVMEKAKTTKKTYFIQQQENFLKVFWNTRISGRYVPFILGPVESW